MTTTHERPSAKKPRAATLRASRRQRLEVRELGLAEHLDARRHDAVVVTGEREPVLLDARMAERPIEAAFAGDQSQSDAELGSSVSCRTVSFAIVSFGAG